MPDSTLSTRCVTRKKAMIAALKKHLGLVTDAAIEVGIDRKTHYDWMNKDPIYKAEVDDVENMVFDFVESRIHKNIRAGREATTIFYAKTKMKKRGYIERQEITGADGGPLQVAVSQQWDAEYRKRQGPVVKPE